MATNQNSNHQFVPRNADVRLVEDAAHRGARKGSAIGAGGGGLIGALISRRRKLGSGVAGAIGGALAGHVAGRSIGIREGAKDVRDARRALNQRNQLAALRADIQGLQENADAREFDRLDSSTEPGPSRQHPIRSYPHAKGPYVPGNGIDDQEAYEMSPLRQKLIEIYGLGVVSALSDDELSDANCRALMREVQASMARANGPHASSNIDPEFERHFLASKLGDKAVSEMPKSLMHCHFEAARRKGLVDLDDMEATKNFAIIDRTRTDTGEFAPEGQVDSQLVQRAYSPTRRKTGIEAGAGVAAGAGLASAIAHLRGKKARTLRLAPGVPKLPPKTIDVDSENLEARLPFLTRFTMGKVGKYPIKRRALRGKKPPTGIRPVSIGKAKPRHCLAFLIQDDDFPLVPSAGTETSARHEAPRSSGEKSSGVAQAPSRHHRVRPSRLRHGLAGQFPRRRGNRRRRHWRCDSAQKEKDSGRPLRQRAESHAAS